MEEYKFFVAVKGLIIKDERFLVIKRSDKARGEHFYWELPGGRLEFNESTHDALVREIEEEVGLSVDVGDPISTWNFVRNKHTQIVGLTFLCRASNDRVILSEEHNDYAWIKYEEIDDYDIFPAVLQEMKKWNWEKVLRSYV